MGLEFGTQKSRDQLSQQLEEINSFAYSLFGLRLLPPGLDNPPGHDQLIQTVQNNLKDTHQVRMSIYQRLLKLQRLEQVLPEADKEELAKWLRILNNLDTYIQREDQKNEARTLFKTQFTVFEDLRYFLEQGNTEGYVKLPTGSGKTVLFIEFAKATGLRTLVVTPTKLLVDQTQERFKEFAPEIETGKVYSNAKEYGKQATIITYSSFVRQIEEGRLNPEEYDLIILDEVHKSLTQKRRDAVSQFPRAIKIGFTATPTYSQDRNVGMLLNTEIHSMSIKEAVEEGLLSSVSVLIAETEVDLSEVRITDSGEYLDRDLERAVNIHSRNSAAINLYLELFNGESCIAYCSTIKHAADLAVLFKERGVKAEVVYGLQNRNTQQEILNRLKTGEIQVVCNADLLIEGFDDPGVTVCLNLRPTTSSVVAEQRAGRVLRYDIKNPNKIAYVIDVIDQNRNKDVIPVSFAQIIENAHLKKKHTQEEISPPTGAGTPHYPDISIAGLKVYTTVEEVMRVVHSLLSQRLDQAPSGWLTLTGVYHRFGISHEYLRKILAPYRESNPEYFQIAKAQGGQTVEMLSPELIAQIAEVAASRPAPIEGWVTYTQLCGQLGVTFETVKSRVNTLRENRPTDLQLFRAKNGRMQEHISPELAAQISTQLEKKDPGNEWHKPIDLATMLGINYDQARRLVARYQLVFPDEIKSFRQSTGITSVFLSSKVCEVIRQEFKAVTSPPKGWISAAQAAIRLDVSGLTARKLAAQYLEKHPEWSGFFRAQNKDLIEYYAPELVVLITEELKRMSNIPDGWISSSSLAEELGVSLETINTDVQEYAKSYSNSVGEFRTQKGEVSGGRRLAYFVSPEIADLIRKKRPKKVLPQEGWRFNNHLAVEYGVSQPRIETIVSPYRITHPEYFRIGRTESGRIVEFFAPDLVEEVVRRLSG